MPFKPGQSGNPRGRAKGAINKATQEIQEFARAHTLKDPVWVAGAIARMNAGDAPHLENYLLQMGYGKPKEVLEVSGPEGGPIPTVDLSKLSDQELDALEAMKRKALVGDDDSAA